MIKAVISDMDGVIYRGSQLIEGARDFVARLLHRRVPFLFLTNNSEQTASDLVRKLEKLGVSGLEERHFLTSARTTALFLAQQKPGARCYVLGGEGLRHELEREGCVLTDHGPDYVVVGKTRSLDYAALRLACRLIDAGARFIGTNPDLVDPVEGEGFEPAAGALLAAVEAATGKRPYVVGKPNALMMLIARKQLGAHSSETLMVGDRMDTDIVAGMEAGMTTVLVLSGVSHESTLREFAFRPDHIFEHVGKIPLDRMLAPTEGPEVP